MHQSIYSGTLQAWGNLEVVPLCMKDKRGVRRSALRGSNPSYAWCVRGAPWNKERSKHLRCLQHPSRRQCTSALAPDSANQFLDDRRTSQTQTYDLRDVARKRKPEYEDKIFIVTTAEPGRHASLWFDQRVVRRTKQRRTSPAATPRDISFEDQTEAACSTWSKKRE